MSNIFLGVEIGGTKLQLALGTAEGQLFAVRQGRVDIERGGKGIRQWLVEQVPDILASSGFDISDVQAIGCGFGGPIDRAAGKVLVSNQVAGWDGFPLRDWLEQAFCMPAWVENDSNTAAWGEYQKGFGRTTQHFFYTNLGSGVGGGLILNGELFDGQGFGAAEFGHMVVPDLRAQPVGKVLELEQVCSGWAIEGRLRQPGYIPVTSELYTRIYGETEQVTTAHLAGSAKTGDRFALSEIDLVAHTLGIGLANVLNLTNIERIAIGGGVSKLGSLLIEPVRRYTAQYVYVSSQGRYQIRQCELGDSIVLIGAILLAKRAFDLS